MKNVPKHNWWQIINLRKKTNIFRKISCTRSESIRVHDNKSKPNTRMVRKKKLTASKFEGTCKMRATIGCKTKVHNLLYMSPITSNEI